MNSFAKKGAALAACALLVFGLSGCGGSSSSASKDTGTRTKSWTN